MIYEIRLGSGDRLRVEKVLASYSVCLKTVPLIKWAKWVWCFRIFIFS